MEAVDPGLKDVYFELVSLESMARKANSKLLDEELSHSRNVVFGKQLSPSSILQKKVQILSIPQDELVEGLIKRYNEIIEGMDKLEPIFLSLAKTISLERKNMKQTIETKKFMESLKRCIPVRQPQDTRSSRIF
nr:hypothetical protein [Candidatus Sigynarchaeum springense]MDO8118802.1 hypothetical protein [Candidatus Sigynarchaeota archaeon]